MQRLLILVGLLTTAGIASVGAGAQITAAAESEPVAARNSPAPEPLAAEWKTVNLVYAGNFED